MYGIQDMMKLERRRFLRVMIADRQLRTARCYAPTPSCMRLRAEWPCSESRAFLGGNRVGKLFVD
jgi:hypothetical protein